MAKEKKLILPRGTKIPDHIAIIPDGNRRWAKKKILDTKKGHEKGAQRFEKLYEKIAEMKIPYFSFWGASYDNLTKRSKSEINNLKNLGKQARTALKKINRDKSPLILDKLILPLEEAAQKSEKFLKLSGLAIHKSL